MAIRQGDVLSGLGGMMSGGMGGSPSPTPYVGVSKPVPGSGTLPGKMPNTGVVPKPTQVTPTSIQQKLSQQKQPMRGIGGGGGLTPQMIQNYLAWNGGTETDARELWDLVGHNVNDIRFAPTSDRLQYDVKGGHMKRDPASGLYYDNGPQGEIMNWMNAQGEKVGAPEGWTNKTKTSEAMTPSVVTKPLPGVGGGITPIVPTTAQVPPSPMSQPGLAPTQPFGISPGPQANAFNPIEQQRRRQLSGMGGMDNGGGNLFGLT